MAVRTLSFLARYDVPPTILWEVVADHEGMTRWLDVDIRVVAGPGDGGVGTVRRLRGPLGLSIDEEVVAFEPPHRMVYRIVRGLPLSHHRGDVRVSRWDGGSQLWWDITLASSVPGLAEGVARVLGPAINRGLRKLGELLESG